MSQLHTAHAMCHTGHTTLPCAVLLYCGAGQFGRSSRVLQLAGVYVADVGATAVRKSPRGSFWIGAGGGGTPAAPAPAMAEYKYLPQAQAGGAKLAPPGTEDTPDARAGVDSAGAAATKDVDATRSFLLQSSTKSFIVQAADAGKAAEWRSAISGAAAACRRSAGGSAGEQDAAPVWEVDSEVPACRLCAVQFGMLVRK